MLFVLRPVAREVTATLREPDVTGGEDGAVLRCLLTAKNNCCRCTSEPADEACWQGRKNKTYQLQQGIFEQVSEHIRREPAQSTRLIEAWIGTSEERS